jgi:hypothetical protein
MAMLAVLVVQLQEHVDGTLAELAGKFVAWAATLKPW